MMKASIGPILNLGHLTPDPALIPPIGRALAAAARSTEVQNNVPTPISKALLAAVEPDWPFPASYFLATHGGADAVDLGLRTSVRPGDKVLVQVPTVSRVLDILDSIGAVAVPIETHDNGPDLAQIRNAVRTRPAGFIYQPGGNHSSGRSVSAAWIDDAARLLADIYMPIIEVTQTPFLEARPWRSLGQHLPQSVVHVHSYNFFFGSDLRVGVAAGSAYYVDRMWQRLTFSSSWVSRILQDALAFQLTDAEAQDHLGTYLDLCRSRHHSFSMALRRVGFDLPETTGPTIWLPVPDENAMTTRLSRQGIVVHPGRYFSPTPPNQHHVLINGTMLAQDHDEMAFLLARAAGLEPS
jgi:DNA-binding transcriptional MocR family regulator